MSKVQKKQTNIREKLTELLDFRKMRDRLSGLGLYVGKDRTNTDENLLVRGGANVDDLQLAEISASVGGTAVDVFVYDTSRDSDGGKWRERTQHTSWYNEELNTAIRGDRREFPAVAVIVAEVKKVTIYDGDDPDLSMWMVFEGTAEAAPHDDFWRSRDVTSCFMLNGLLIFGTTGNDQAGLKLVSFSSDSFYCVDDNGDIYSKSYRFPNQGISQRNNNDKKGVEFDLNIVSGHINDVAMTVLPNAPIDDATGLPVPTIAVATDGGVSVIKDDGTVVDSFSTANFESIAFSQSIIYSTRGASVEVWRFDDYSSDGFSGNAYDSKSSRVIEIAPLAGQGVDSLYSNEDLEVASANGLSRIHENSNLSKGMLAYTTSKYNTGWMPGDIKLAALSDSVVENVGVNSDEIIQNGESWTIETGSTAPTEWIEETDESATFSLSSGELTITQTGTAPAKIYQAFDVIKGRVYNIEARIKRGSSGIARFQITNNSTGAGSYFLLSDITSTTYQTITKQIRAEETGQYSVATTCYTSGGGGEGSAVFDYVRVRATTELITNGDFSNGTTGWTGLSGGVLSIDNERLKIEETTNAVDAYAVNSSVISTVVGQKYLITWQFIKGTNAGFSVRFGNSGDQTYDYKSNIVGEYTADGYYSFEFTATATELNLSFIVNEMSTYGFVDNISVRPAEEDRSVNGNGLQIVGEINKTPVASGADLVAYSGFSANNYLVQPYNEDLDFGTGDFSVMGWVKVSDMGSSTYSLIYRSSEAITGNYYHCSLNVGKLKFARHDGTAEDDLAGSTDLGDNTWHHFCGVYEGGDLKIYVDGRSDANKVTADHTGSVDDSSAVLTLGIRPNSTQFLDGGSLALCRVSATAPTAEQIAKIYRDEKPLFQEGAQATLYGTSDATTALSYDEKTELLHVGTSAGRSDFSGLRRINNTTTAITTSISAHNNLIAEQ